MFLVVLWTYHRREKCLENHKQQTYKLWKCQSLGSSRKRLSCSKCQDKRFKPYNELTMAMEFSLIFVFVYLHLLIGILFNTLCRTIIYFILYIKPSYNVRTTLTHAQINSHLSLGLSQINSKSSWLFYPHLEEMSLL